MIPQDINPLYAALENSKTMDEYLELHTSQYIIDHVKLYVADQVNNNHNQKQQEMASDRRFFAGMAMQLFCTNADYLGSPDEIASGSVVFADALIKELQKPIKDENS